MSNNPYAAPKTHVEDVPEAVDGNFLPEGRGTPAGNGWRWIADAWTFTSGQRLVFIGVILLMWVVQIAVNLVPLIGPIASTFLFPFLVGGVTLGCETVRRGGRLEVGHLFAGFQRHTNKLLLVGAASFVMYILLGIVLVVLLGATVGLAFLTGAQPNPEDFSQMLLPALLAVCVVIAISVPVTMALLFVPALVVINDAEVLPALRASFVACLKNVVPFLIWGVASLVLWLLSTVVFVIVGWVIVGTFLFVSLYLSYRDIFYDTEVS